MMTTIVKLGTQIQNINMRFAVEFESNSSLSRRWCTFPPIERLPRLMNRSNSTCQSIKSLERQVA